MFSKNLAEKNVIILPPPNPKYTLRDWEFNNKAKTRISEDQQKLANRVISESERVIDETRSVTDQWKKEADYRLKERIIDVQFQRDEILKQKKDAYLEEEALKTYRQRVINAIDNLREEAMILCQKCIILRENRVGVDLVHDEVDVELHKELNVIQGCQLLLNKVLEENNEQIRRLRAMMYLLDRDLSNKEKTLQIDEQNLLLKENQLDMHVYEGSAPLDPFNTTINQWIEVTSRNIAATAKELNSAKPLRSYIDILLRQVVEDLESQVSKTNEAFKKRISETRYAKIRLENLHRESSNQVNEVTRNITRLEKELADKEGYLALAQMRLANRTQRPGVEMCRDAVQDTLVKELNALKATCSKLSRMLDECKTALRYLLNTQMQQEEELNTKTNTLKVDEVDCMTVRQSLVFNKF